MMKPYPVQVVEQVHKRAQRQDPRINPPDETVAALPVLNEPAAFEHVLWLLLEIGGLLIVMLATAVSFCAAETMM